MFNPKLKIFHYVLDETEHGRRRSSSRRRARPHPGRQAHRLCVLQGSSAGPENPDRRVRRQHARQQLFRRAVRPAARTISSKARRCATRSCAVRPQLKGQIDRFGGAPDGSIRFMIGPYLPYRALSDLDPIHACAREETEAAGLLSLLCHRRRIRWYGGAEAEAQRRARK